MSLISQIMIQRWVLGTKMGLRIFTTNTLYKHILRAHLPSYEYLFHLLSLYYFLLEVNLLKK